MATEANIKPADGFGFPVLEIDDDFEREVVESKGQTYLGEAPSHDEVFEYLDAHPEVIAEAVPHTITPTVQGYAITIGEGWDHYSDGDCYFFHITVDKQREITIDFNVDEDKENNLVGQPNCFVDRDIRNEQNERTDYASITLAEDATEILEILAMPAADVLKRFAQQIEDVKTETTDQSKL